MPQISVEYSESLSEAFDRHGFALALHPAAAELIGSSVPDFKTRFRTTGETVIGSGGPGEAMIHVDLAILPGRSAELKARLGELALATLSQHFVPVKGLRTQVTVEIRDIASYYKQVYAV